MMYYFPYLFLLRMARDLRYMLGRLDFDICGAFELVD